MKPIYYVIPELSANPHTSAHTENLGPKPTTQLEPYFNHFDKFNPRQFVSTEMLPFLPKEAIKIISVFVYLPASCEFTIDKKLRKAVNTDPNTFLGLWSVQEAQLNEARITTALAQNKINKDKAILITTNYENHLKKVDNVSHVFINYWESYTRRCFRLTTNLSRITPKQRLASLDSATKKFISLNRNVRHHRLWWYYAICKLDLLNESHVSYLLPEISPRLHNEFMNSNLVKFKLPENMRDSFASDFKKICKLRKLDDANKKWIINFQNGISNFYHDSLFSLVTESSIRANFVTEKTYKAIYHMHPFFIVGIPEQHKLLRDRGYYTFEDFFGVGEVTDYSQAVDLLAKIKKTSVNEYRHKVKKHFDKLEHNMYNFVNREISWLDFERDLRKAVNGQIR